MWSASEPGSNQTDIIIPTFMDDTTVGDNCDKWCHYYFNYDNNIVIQHSIEYSDIEIGTLNNC